MSLTERWAARRARARDERGAVAVLMVSAVVVLVLIAAFAVDLGMQRVARRDMQSLADTVALDLSRLLDGRTTSEIRSGTAVPQVEALSTSLNRSVNRNVGTTLGEPTAGCTSGAQGTVSSVSGACVRAFLVLVLPDGSYATTPDGWPVETTGAVIPTGVVVDTRTTVPFAFGGLTGVGAGDVGRSAVAINQQSACFKLGSYAAAVNSGDAALLAPLNGLLGLNLDLLSYQGLAGADLSIADLVATGLLGGTPDEVLNSETTVGEFVAASIQALQNDGDDATAGGEVDVEEENDVATVVLQQVVAAGVDVGQPVRVGELVNVDPSDTAGLMADFNLLDLVAGTVLLADGDSAVSIPALTAGTAGIGTISSTLKVIERSRLACGTVALAPSVTECEASTVPRPRGCALNSQLTGKVTIPLTLGAINGFVVSNATSVLDLSLGNAAGVLTSPAPVCRAGTAGEPDQLTVRTRTSAVTSTLATSLQLKRVIEVALPGVPAVVVAGVTVTPAIPGQNIRVVVEFSASNLASVPTAENTKDNALLVPPNDETPVSGNSKAALGNPTVAASSDISVKIDNNGDGVGDVALSTLGTVVEVAVSAVIDPIINTAVSQVLNVALPAVTGPLVNSLNNQLINPLADLLGLEVAGADVFAVQRPTCETPRLAG
ncbi:pilus assembly protein TadG-related protein [Nocardioides sp.]|uniref:pilus assembly protein TadG-related protein n=1 Tax=Nocardioides sp. TaxID=35761 RepID=UPI002B26A3FA|nr:pilus assembly protein TadG-related protein [Nocardioides sp.]